MATKTRYLTSTATSSPYPTTSRLLSASQPSSEVTLGPGEFDSGFPGTTDCGQWNPSSPIGDTTAAAEIDNTGSSLGTTRQGWLLDEDLTGQTVTADEWFVQLRLAANQGSGLAGHVFMRATVVTGSSGTWVTVANLFTTVITGEQSHTTGQAGWHVATGGRINVNTAAGNYYLAVADSGTASSHQFQSGERLLIEIGFGDGDSTSDRTWRLDYNTANCFVVTPNWTTLQEFHEYPSETVTPWSEGSAAKLNAKPALGETVTSWSEDIEVIGGSTNEEYVEPVSESVTLSEGLAASQGRPAVALAETVTIGGGGTTWVSGPGSLGGLKKVDGEVRVITADIDSAARFVGAACTSDQYSKITLGATALDTHVNYGPMVRIQGDADGSCYVVYTVSNNTLVLAKVTDTGESNSFSTLNTFGPSLSAGDTIELRAVGGVLHVYHNGTELGTGTTDGTPYSGGQPGIHGYADTTGASRGLHTAWEGGSGSSGGATSTFDGSEDPLVEGGAPGESVEALYLRRVAPSETVTLSEDIDETYTPAGVNAYHEYPAETVTPWNEAVGTVGPYRETVSESVTLSESVRGRAPNAFPLTVSADARYLVDSHGVPFFYSMRTVWFIYAADSTDLETFLDDTEDKGYRVINFHPIGHDPRGYNVPYAGNDTLPFLKRLDGQNWNGSLSYGDIYDEAPDFTTPNESYWAYIDGFIEECENRNIAVNLFPIYFGYSGGSQGWCQEALANGTTKVETYAAWIANRYADRGNIIWGLGGDYSPSTQAEIDVEQAMIDGIESVGDRLSVHYAAEWNSTVDPTAKHNTDFASYITINGAYSWSDVVGTARTAYSYSPTLPAVMQEGPFDEEGPDGTNVNSYATQPVRRYSWWEFLSTCAGYNNGNGYVWTLSQDPLWLDHLSTQTQLDDKRLNQFLATIAWWTLRPEGLGGCPTLITAGGSDCTAARTTDASLLLVYIGPGHSGSVTIDLSKMAGRTFAHWFDPTSAEKSYIGTYANSGTQAFTPTGNNDEGTYDDWVLILTSAFLETVSLAESQAALAHVKPALAETVSVSEDIATAIARHEVVAEEVTLSEAIAAVPNDRPALAETVTPWNEEAAAEAGLLVGIGENLGTIAEAVADKLGTLAAVNETVTLSDGIGSGFDAMAAPGETVSLSESIAAISQGEYVADLSESWGSLTEVLASLAHEHVAPAEDIGAMGGTLATVTRLHPALAENIGAMGGTVAASCGIHLVLSANMGTLSEILVGRGLAKITGLAEGLGSIGEIIATDTWPKRYIEGIGETLSLAEIVTILASQAVIMSLRVGAQPSALAVGATSTRAEARTSTEASGYVASTATEVKP